MVRRIICEVEQCFEDLLMQDKTLRIVPHCSIIRGCALCYYNISHTTTSYCIVLQYFRRAFCLFSLNFIGGILLSDAYLTA